MTSAATSGGLALPYPLLFIAGALILPLLPRQWRSPFWVAVPVVALLVWVLGGLASPVEVPYAAYRLVVQQIDGLAVPFMLAITLTLLVGSIYAFHIKDTAEKAAALLYGAAALGIVLAGDWLTFYFAWEMAAWTSLYLVWAPANDKSGGAGQRYVMMHLFGGSMLLAGIWLHVQQSGTLAITSPDYGSLAGWLILLGMAVNLAIPPLHAWLPDAYPRATITGSVFLSALTTKTTVYAIARVFPGWEILIWAGVLMALYGVLFAVMENNMRRLLSYHIVSQVGYMVAGVGLGTALSLNGAVSHAFANMFEKGLLFMGVGLVIYATGREGLNQLGGLAVPFRRAFLLFMIGAVSISGFPLLGAFVTKAMTIDAYSASQYPVVSLLLKLAAVGTFLSIGLKLAYFIWFGEKDRQYEPFKPVPGNMYVAMALTGALLFGVGIFSKTFYRLLPYSTGYQAYTAAHLSETIQLLLFSLFTFVLLLQFATTKALLTLDTDWFYRKIIPWLRWQAVEPLAAAILQLDRTVEQGIQQLVGFVENPRFSGTADLMVGIGVVLATFLLLTLGVLLGATA